MDTFSGLFSAGSLELEPPQEVGSGEDEDEDEEDQDVMEVEDWDESFIEDSVNFDERAHVSQKKKTSVQTTRKKPGPKPKPLLTSESDATKVDDYNPLTCGMKCFLCIQ